MARYDDLIIRVIPSDDGVIVEAQIEYRARLTSAETELADRLAVVVLGPCTRRPSHYRGGVTYERAEVIGGESEARDLSALMESLRRPEPEPEPEDEAPPVRESSDVGF